MFPLERPTRSDFKLWNETLGELVSSSLMIQPPLYNLLCKGHKKHSWLLPFDLPVLYFLYEAEFEDTFDICVKAETPHATRYGKCYME